MVRRWHVEWKKWCLVGVILILKAASTHGAPIEGVTPRTMFFLGTGVRFYVKNINKEDRASKGMDTTVRRLLLSYSFMPDVVATLNISYVERRMAGRSSEGPGDTWITVKYRFFHRDFPRGSTMVAVLGGIKLPTGSHTERDALGVLPHPVQPGTGSWDYLFGILGGHLTYRYNIEGGLRYRINTRGSGMKMANPIMYDLSVQWKFHPAFPVEASQINLGVELNGVWKGKNRMNDTPVMDTGGNVVLFSPGVQYILSERTLVEISYQVPVVKDTGRMEPVTENAILGGFRYIF